MGKLKSNLLQRLKAGSNVTQEVAWPGTEDTMVRLRVLNDSDYLQATISADKILTNVTMANVSRYNAELETQLLFRSITDPESGNQLGTITEFRQLLSPEIKVSLVDLLDLLHSENSPEISSLNEEEFDKLFIDVKKKPEETLLSVSSTDTLRRLVKSLVKQVK